MAVLKTALFGLVLTGCVFCVTSGGQFPKFTPIPDTFDKSDIVPAFDFVAPVLPKSWYASWPTSMRMTVLGKENIQNFVLNCFTETLSGDFALSEIKFCFDNDCKTLATSGTITKTLRGPKGKEFPVRLSFSSTNGGSVNYEQYVGIEKDISTKFSCSVKNVMGTLHSNTLQILDLRSRTPSESWLRRNSPAQSLPKNGPQTFQCFKNSVPPGENEPAFNVNWAYCSTPGAVDPSQCVALPLDSVVRSLGDRWPAHVRKNGDLYIPFFPDGVVNSLGNRVLSCRLNQQPVTYYMKPLTFNDDKSPNEIKSLKMIQPKGSEKVTIFNSKATSVTFPCNFEMGPGTYSVIWRFRPKNGGAPQAISSPIRNKQGVSLANKPNSIKFQGPFSDMTVGTYACEVRWNPTSGATSQTATGSYDLEVQFFPTVSEKMVPLKYVVDGNDGVVECLFEGLLVTPSLAINGENIDLKSQQTVEDSIKTVNSNYMKVMSSLNVEVKPVSPGAGKVITYTAKKMDYRSPLSKLPSTHTVQCIGTNEVGSVRANTLLKVVPKPIMVAGKAPSSLNCSECSAAESHTIHCEVSNKAAINQSGVVFKQYWMLGKQRVDDLLAVADAPARKYLAVLPDNSLVIRKIDDEEFKKTVNDMGKVECVLTLGYPASAKLPPEVKPSGVEQGLFFVSSHTDMRKELTTPIKLTEIAPQMKTGSMMWIIPVILALIVILIIIGATYYCCRQRKSGEEYNVDAKEKQQGNDPEVEVAEKEAFPVFERPEDGPIRGSRASLDDSIHVGSDDEDEVLAEYDVDIGKFDEEGSFIGQYAVNDGTATGNRRLPQVGNNTEV